MKDKIFRIGPMIYSRFQVFKWRLGSYLKDQEGATAIEYGLVVAVIVILVISAASFMFDPLKEFFLGIVKKIKGIAGV